MEWEYSGMSMNGKCSNKAYFRVCDIEYNAHFIKYYSVVKK